MQRSNQIIKALIAEALGVTPSDSVANLVSKLESERKAMATLDRYTTFSRWYKGEHGQVYRRLRSAARALVIALKQSVEPRDATLLPYAREYYDYVSTHGGAGSRFEISDAIKRWREGGL